MSPVDIEDVFAKLARRVGVLQYALLEFEEFGTEPRDFTLFEDNLNVRFSKDSFFTNSYLLL